MYSFIYVCYITFCAFISKLILITEFWMYIIDNPNSFWTIKFYYNQKKKSFEIKICTYQLQILITNSHHFVKDIPIRNLFYSSILYHKNQHDERRERSKFLILVERIRSTFLLHCC